MVLKKVPILRFFTSILDFLWVLDILIVFLKKSSVKIGIVKKNVAISIGSV